MNPKDINEGHSKEWQDRARVVVDAKEAAETEASPNQSPFPGEDTQSDEEKRKDTKPQQGNDPVY